MQKELLKLPAILRNVLLCKIAQHRHKNDVCHVVMIIYPPYNFSEKSIAGRNSASALAVARKFQRQQPRGQTIMFRTDDPTGTIVHL